MQVHHVRANLIEERLKIRGHRRVVEVVAIVPSDPRLRRDPTHRQPGLVALAPTRAGRMLVAEPPRVHPYVVAAPPHCPSQPLRLLRSAAHEIGREVGRHHEDPHVTARISITFSPPTRPPAGHEAPSRTP